MGNTRIIPVQVCWQRRRSYFDRHIIWHCRPRKLGGVKFVMVAYNNISYLYSSLIVRFAMSGKTVRSNFVESGNHIHFWKAQTFLKPKTNVSIWTETFFGPRYGVQNGHHLISVFDNIFQTKQYTNVITRDMPTSVLVRGNMDEKYNFGGGHLGFQDARHAKSSLLYSSPTGQDSHISRCTYIFGSRKIWVNS